VILSRVTKDARADATLITVSRNISVVAILLLLIMVTVLNESIDGFTGKRFGTVSPLLDGVEGLVGAAVVSSLMLVRRLELGTKE
jgi:CDP-diglyceride synthetase